METSQAQFTQAHRRLSGQRLDHRAGQHGHSQLAQLAVEEQQAEEDGERAEVELLPLLVDPVRHGLGVGKAQSRRRRTGFTAAAQPPAGPLAAQPVKAQPRGRESQLLEAR